MQKKTVVYIEDRKEDILLLERVVKREFNTIELVTFSNSEDVLKSIKNESFNKLSASAVLIDINMPKISGLELLKAFSENKIYNKLPKIIFSSSKERTDISTAYQYHCNSFIEKPKSFTTLKLTVKETLDYWLNINLN
ncbi:response regulator [Polaribacter sp. WD7]|uniref:response regulator n=1 Tax=Polaribacter sp. WD7 TaxID=2269061 RepID=UPI000DF24B29|nr:response regulator [Polaribacter sp. WD7]RCS27761.1 response regulator [Polaribacter sp. WD7]